MKMFSKLKILNLQYPDFNIEYYNSNFRLRNYRYSNVFMCQINFWDLVWSDPRLEHSKFENSAQVQGSFKANSELFINNSLFKKCFKDKINHINNWNRQNEIKYIPNREKGLVIKFFSFKFFLKIWLVI